MDLATANINLSGAELELVVADMRDVRLKEALKPLRKHYDFIVAIPDLSKGSITFDLKQDKIFLNRYACE
jgi:chromosome partitioning protein